MIGRLTAMMTHIHIERAGTADAPEIAAMVGELLAEIMAAIRVQAFRFDLDDTAARLNDLIGRGQYVVFVARCEKAKPVGFVTLYESYALYAEGAFGTIPELYVHPDYRGNGVGFGLVTKAKSYGVSQGWKRLEVTTPPLPEFERTLAFYEREGFAVTGGRKLKATL